MANKDVKDVNSETARKNMELLPSTRKYLLSARGRCTLACVSSVSIARRLYKLIAGTIRYSKGA